MKVEVIKTPSHTVEQRYEEASDFYSVTLDDGENVMCEIRTNENPRLSCETGVFHDVMCGSELRTCKPITQEVAEDIYYNHIAPLLQELGEEAGWL